MKIMSDHHAVLYQTHEREVIDTVALKAELTFNVARIEVDQFGIDNSKALIREMFRTSPGTWPSGFLVVTGTMTEEAQNALLKALEEPPRGVCVWLFLLPEARILPTLRSRFQIIGTGGAELSLLPPEFTAWLLQTLPEKLSVIEKYTKNKNTKAIKALAQGSLRHLAVNHRNYSPSLTKRLQYAASHIGTRGASNKMLLEEVALLFSSIAKTR